MCQVALFAPPASLPTCGRLAMSEAATASATAVSGVAAATESHCASFSPLPPNTTTGVPLPPPPQAGALNILGRLGPLLPHVAAAWTD